MDRVAPGHDGPRFEIQSIVHSLDDLAPHSLEETDKGHQTTALVWAAGVLICMLAFGGWLLIS